MKKQESSIISLLYRDQVHMNRIQDCIHKLEFTDEVVTRPVTEKLLNDNPCWTEWGTMVGDIYATDGELEAWLRDDGNQIYPVGID